MCNFECSCVCLPTLHVSDYLYEQGGNFVAVVKLAGVFECEFVVRTVVT